MEDRGAEPRGSDSPVDWVADAVSLPPDSEWDATVRVVSVTEAELARQRFAFTMSATGVDEGRVRTVLDLGTAVAGILVVGGALALGVALGGGRLPDATRTRRGSLCVRAGWRHSRSGSRSASIGSPGGNACQPAPAARDIRLCGRTGAPWSDLGVFEPTP